MLRLNIFNTENDSVAIYNSRENKTPRGAVESGSRIEFTVKIARRYAKNPRLKINADEGGTHAVNMIWIGFEKGYDVYRTSAVLETGLYWYWFETDLCRIFRRGGEKWQITVFEKGFKTPESIKGGIIYHIFIDRFYRGRETPVKENAVLRNDWGAAPEYRPDENGIVRNCDFFGGNFSGIQKKLEYIKSLGVSAVYLSPVFEAESNHKYDTGDYLKTDEMFGDEKEFKELLKTAKERGIQIICDGVFNHTGADSVYFNKYGHYESVGAYNSKKSPYYGWYSFNVWPDDYRCWWGIKILPAVNGENREFINFITNKVIDKWMSAGVDSWRLDVADELSDKMLGALRTKIKSKNPEGLIIGEVWEDASNKTSYGKRRKYLQGGQLDSVMNYPLKDAIISFVKYGDAQTLAETLEYQQENYPKQVIDCLMNILGTHDTMRILTALGTNRQFENKDEMADFSLSDEEYKTAEEKLKAACVLQMFLPGVPCIYYGDEAGMQGCADPFNRRCYPWGGENKRILDFYRKTASLRRTCGVLAKGGYECLKAEDGVFIFRRFDETREVTVGINVSGAKCRLKRAVYNLLDEESVSEIKKCVVYLKTAE